MVTEALSSGGMADGQEPASWSGTNGVRTPSSGSEYANPHGPQPIAIVGMGMRLPGGIHSSDDFWKLLVEKGDGRCRVPGNRYNIDAFQSSKGTRGTVKSQYGYFLQDSEFERFDAAFFSMNQTEVEKLDPQQRMLLEVVWECMESGGQREWRGRNIGCYVGVFGEDWLDLSAKDPQHLGMYRITGSGDFALSNRVSYEYDLKGPSMTIRTGCSSSLIGLHEACQAIYAGECESAVVAGTNLIITPSMTISMTEQGVLSPTGSCKSFDARADGYARGEAINAIYIKKLDDALRDGDPIRAVIRATATNCDGKTPGIANPSAESHEAMIRRAYQVAGITDISKTGFVECHGTGTAIGDPLEVTAVGNVFGGKGVLIGSVILESAESFKPRAGRESQSSSARPHLLTFSADHPDSLRESVTQIEAYYQKDPSRLADVAHTLGARRDHLAWRAYAVSEEGGPIHVSQFVKTKSAPQLNFVFTGQGAQWAGMGQTLFNDFPQFREDIRMMDNALQKTRHAPLWTLEEELFRPAKQARVDRAEFSQPICTAVQVGLVNLLRSWGIAPAAVVGHSSGEIAAAYAVNAITSDAAIQIAYYRGQVTKQQLSPGGMAAVGLGRSEMTPLLRDGVVIACENSPSSVTISGDEDQLEACIEGIKSAKPDTFVRRLKVDMAYHSHHMRAVGNLYQSVMEGLVHDVQPSAPLFSSVSGKKIVESGHLGPSYWRANLESPVLFYTAVQSMLEESGKEAVFLEVGPHAALSGPLRSIFKAHRPEAVPVYMACMARGENNTQTLLDTVGRLFQQAVPVRFEGMSAGNKVLTDLPKYPWRHDKEYWCESRVARQWRLRPFAPHELLGTRTLESNELDPTWRNMISLDDIPWARDHKIREDVVFPAACYIAMAGEAIRQTADASDFSIRRMDIKVALVLTESNPVEVMTRLSPVRLTTSLNSVWYEFSVVSYNGVSWTKHCEGQVRKGSEQPPSHAAVHTYPRAVSSDSWYYAMRRVGLNYGREFQGLSNISANPGKKEASASVSDRSDGEANYQLHPTTIDFCLQLFTAAMTDGIGRHLTKLCIPTSIEELYVSRGSPDMRVAVSVSGSGNGAISGNGVIVAGTQPVMRLTGGRFSPLEDEVADGSSDTVAGAEMHWKPSIDFIAAEELIRPLRGFREDTLKLERFSLLCLLEVCDRISSLDASSAHLKKYKSWISTQKLRAERGQYELVEDAVTLASMNRAERLRLLKAAKQEVEDSAGSLVGRVVENIVEHAEAIFGDNKEALEVLMQDGGLEDIYRFMQDIWDCQEYFELLSHANPTMRVLEIGAGTGGTTSTVLRDLTQSGERKYSQYDYTDISSGFFAAASEKFQDYENIEYKVLDITKDPLAQGFEAASYDLVIAANVLHATPNISETLCNVRKLLKNGGRLFLQELSPVWRVFNLIMGLLPGWWLGEADGRPQEPYMAPSRWDAELRNAGFAGAQSVVYDDEQPYQINFTLVTTSTASPTPPSSSRQVTLLHAPGQDAAVERLSTSLLAAGITAVPQTLADAPPAADGRDVLAILDLAAPFFADIAAPALAAFQAYLAALGIAAGSPGVLWVTRPAQAGCRDARYGQSIGVARTVRSELSLAFGTLEVAADGVDDEDGAIVRVFEHFAAARRAAAAAANAVLDPDYEYAFFGGRVHVSRFRWVGVADRLCAAVQNAPKKLDIGRMGQLRTLQWVEDKREEESLGEDEVEVEPRAVGMNFKDVLVAMGIVKGTKPGLGLEGTGVIRKVGSGVEDLKVGDRVLVFDHGCFATRLVISANLCAKMPDSLSFEDGATMPCVYSTAIYALMTLGHLEKGQTVLIHSACGGVGLAAIQLCRMIGAEIFVTVGNEEKARYLRETFGISQDRIFNSRDASFLGGVLAGTGGRGVDLVLNSLSGELLHASWKCVAEFGKMLEIGKRDFVGHGMLNMDLFEANRTFVGIDLAQLAVERPQVCRRLLDQCMEFYRRGSIQPIRPIRTFAASEIIETFRYMQKGQHIGKLVVTMPEQQTDVETVPTRSAFKLRSDASYLLCGGLGGLGRAVSNWMVENGARHIIYLSRTAGHTAEDKAFFSELHAQGCRVQAIRGSVAHLKDVERAVREAGKPIAGVMHMSMVLRDRAFLQFTHEDWHAAIEPKVRGAENLHHALSEATLDFFIVFSSISCIVGQIGQANYAAANAFLSAFTQYRHSLGLPASVLNVGVMEDVGYVSQNAGVLDQLKALCNHTLQEQDLLDALEYQMQRQMSPTPSPKGFMSPAELVIGLRSTRPLTEPNNRAIWKRDVRMAQYRNTETATQGSTTAGGADLKRFLAEVATMPAMLDVPANVDILAQEIGTRIYSLMLKPEEELDVDLSLTALGIDSLVAIEIKNWWRQSLGLEISVLEISNSGSIRQLAKTAAEGLKNKFRPAVQSDGDKYLLMKAP
ncbi:Hybrid PKS-NRPS synthetase lepA [Lasiodiplodia theobromae]|uniref:Hybrid PKS-NRPS synthetase lepA n=1 Tax=Lasiodiplodia theobromae TaxID=45133 RepID=A0A5N5CZA2_9PEZI|nr:Hybrid PKS-NRPS synthetase lepA [Lasiodiplodia theobromae]